MSNLDAALERSRKMIEEALAEARAELAELDQRRAALLEQIGEAEAILGGGGTRMELPRSYAVGTAPGLTLHEALIRVLEDAGNEWMTARELADEVNRRGLYRQRDGSAVEVNQVHARTKNYVQLFEKDGPRVRLKGEASVIAMTGKSNLLMFKDDDEGFFNWQHAHPHGEFINTERKPNPNYLVLHKSGCPHFRDEDSRQWTRDYVKVTSEDREALETWAQEIVGGDITLCGTCFPA